MAGFFSRLKEGLSKTRENIVHGIDSVFSGFSSIDEEFYEELEEILIMGDIGVNATNDIDISNNIVVAIMLLFIYYFQFVIFYYILVFCLACLGCFAICFFRCAEST